MLSTMCVCGCGVLGGIAGGLNYESAASFTVQGVPHTCPRLEDAG